MEDSDPPLLRGSETPSRPSRGPGGRRPCPREAGLVAGRLATRLATLEVQLNAGDQWAWPDYLAPARTLAVIWPLPAPGQHRLLTTAELAARLSISPKTLRRRRALGLIQPALGHGRLVRWQTDQGIR